MFSADIGVPYGIKPDLHPSFTGKHTIFQQYLHKNHIVMKNSESKKMISKNVPR